MHVQCTYDTHEWMRTVSMLGACVFNQWRLLTIFSSMPRAMSAERRPCTMTECRAAFASSSMEQPDVRQLGRPAEARIDSRRALASST